MWLTKLQLWKSKDKEFRFCVLSFNIIVIVQSLSHVQLFVTPSTSVYVKLPCPSPSPIVFSNSCPLSQWCHPTILCSVIPFSSCPWSLPASRSFPIKQPLASGGKSIGVSASISVLPMGVQGWFAIGFTGSSSLLYKGLSRIFSQESSPAPQFKSINSLALTLFYCPALTSVND